MVHIETQSTCWLPTIQHQQQPNLHLKSSGSVIVFKSFLGLRERSKKLLILFVVAHKCRNNDIFKPSTNIIAVNNEKIRLVLFLIQN